jgi:hypothetical protein
MRVMPLLNFRTGVLMRELVALKQQFEFTKESVAKAMELWETVDCFGGVIACHKEKDFGTAVMQLLVDGSDFADEGNATGSGGVLEVYPSTEATLVNIERWRDTALPVQEGFDGADPGGVFSPGVKEGTVGWIQSSDPCPLRIGSPGCDPGRKFAGRHRPRDAEALCDLAPEAEKEDALFDGFNTFGYGLATESGGEAKHALDNGEVFGVIEHVVHEGLIDFEDINGKALEKGEGGVAGAEVVEGEGDTQFAAGVNDLRNLGHVRQGGTFEHLDFEARRIDGRVRSEDRMES